MRILDNEENLASFLDGVHERVVTIVSAFASGTEGVVDLLLKHGNRLELLVGTINSFSSPDFFGYCKSIESEHFSMFVDFGYQHSIHWKLYLIEPETIIIGSANFTSTGLSMTRDTCVVIENKTLFERYIQALAAIKLSSNVVGSQDPRFDDYLQKYRENHRRMQVGRVRVVQVGDGNEWLSAEENQLITIFIWDSMHTRETIDEAHNLLKDYEDKEPTSVLLDFFTYECEESDLPYNQGDLVLCMNSKGSYADFYSFDRILYKDGFNYIYSYRKKRYTRPFRLSNEIKSEIKSRVGDWYEREVTLLGRAEIQDVIKSANAALQRTSR